MTAGLGRGDWPIVVGVALVLAFLLIVTWHGDSEDTKREQQRKQMQIECIKAGGEVGEHNGWATCKQPLP